MLERIGQVPAHIPISFIYGSRSNIDSESGYAFKSTRPDVEIKVGLFFCFFDKKDPVNPPWVDWRDNIYNLLDQTKMKLLGLIKWEKKQMIENQNALIWEESSNLRTTVK